VKSVCTVVTAEPWVIASVLNLLNRVIYWLGRLAIKYCVVQCGVL